MFLTASRVVLVNKIWPLLKFVVIQIIDPSIRIMQHADVNNITSLWLLSQWNFDRPARCHLEVLSTCADVTNKLHGFPAMFCTEICYWKYLFSTRVPGSI
jgi:hypothetical protein